MGMTITQFFRHELDRSNVRLRRKNSLSEGMQAYLGFAK